MRRYIPAAFFAVFLVVLAVGLIPRSKDLPSPLIGKQTPAFRLPVLATPQQSIGSADLLGQAWVLNVWASWCSACRDEHPSLMRLAELTDVPIYGLDYKDQRASAADWLGRYGNPYHASLFDGDGRVGMDYGVYGVPETFVIDRHGVVRHKHVGPLTDEVVSLELLPLLKALQSESVAAGVVDGLGG